MKNFKNISLLTMGFMLFAQLHGSDSQALEFPPHTTEKYIYNKSVETVKHGSIYLAIFGKHPDGISLTDETSEELLSSRVNRKRVETKTENGVSITTTETWSSRNPSYLTWTNGALVVSAIAGIAGIALAAPFAIRAGMAINDPTDPQHKYYNLFNYNYKDSFINWYDEDPAKKAARNRGNEISQTARGYAEGLGLKINR